MTLHHIHTGDSDTDITIYLDLAYDLQIADQLPRVTDETPDDQIEAVETAREKIIDGFTAAYLASLAEVARERDITVWVTGHEGEATRTPIDPDITGDDDTLERSVWQDAHDRTAVPTIDVDA